MKGKLKVAEFQFLIGRVKIGATEPDPWGTTVFQFLIGRVKII